MFSTWPDLTHYHSCHLNPKMFYHIRLQFWLCTMWSEAGNLWSQGWNMLSQARKISPQVEIISRQTGNMLSQVVNMLSQTGNRSSQAETPRIISWKFHVIIFIWGWNIALKKCVDKWDGGIGWFLLRLIQQGRSQV